MTVRVHCDSCGATRPAEGPVGEWATAHIVRGEKHDRIDVDLCPACVERHYASITKDLRVREGIE